MTLTIGLDHASSICAAKTRIVERNAQFYNFQIRNVDGSYWLTFWHDNNKVCRASAQNGGLHTCKPTCAKSCRKHDRCAIFAKYQSSHATRLEFINLLPAEHGSSIIGFPSVTSIASTTHLNIKKRVPTLGGKHYFNFKGWWAMTTATAIWRVSLDKYNVFEAHTISLEVAALERTTRIRRYVRLN